MLDLHLLQRPAFGSGILAGLLSYTVLFGGLFAFPFLLQRVLGASPAEAGLLLATIPLGLGLMAPLSGLWADRAGARAPAITGMLIAEVALGGLSLVVEGGSLAAIVPLLVLFGLGLVLFTPANNSAIMASAPRDRLGIAGGVLNMTRGLGTSLGVALTGAAMAITVAADMGSGTGATGAAPAPILAHAIRVGVVVLTAAAGATVLIPLIR